MKTGKGTEGKPLTDEGKQAEIVPRPEVTGRQILVTLDQVSLRAAEQLRDYFNAPDEPDGGKRIDRALQLLGRVNGMQSTRLKGIALKLQAAKLLGLRGEQLQGLLGELTDTSTVATSQPAQPAIPAAASD